MWRKKWNRTLKDSAISALRIFRILEWWEQDHAFVLEGKSIENQSKGEWLSVLQKVPPQDGSLDQFGS
jgi:hypothetical protein